MKNVPIKLIHHNKDADGYLSVEIFNFFLQTLNKYSDSCNYDVQMIGYNYEFAKVSPTFEELNKSNYWLNVQDVRGTFVFIDCTPPVWWLTEVTRYYSDSVQVIIIDHHAYACENIKNNYPSVKLLYDNSMSASKIVYDSVLNYPLVLTNFFLNSACVENTVSIGEMITKDLKDKLDNQTFKNVLQLVNDYDIWDWYNEYKTSDNIKPKVMYTGITEHYCNDINISVREELKMNGHLRDYFEGKLSVENMESNFKTLGRGMVDKEIDECYNQKYIKLKYYFVTRDTNKSFQIALVDSRVNFFITEVLLDNGIDIVMYHSKLEEEFKYKVGMRSRGDIDVAEFMRVVTDGNGGGHKNASGGTMDMLTFRKFFDRTIALSGIEKIKDLKL